MNDLEKYSILCFWLRSLFRASTALASITFLSALIFLNSRSWSSADFVLNIFSFRNSIVSLLSWCSFWCSGRIVRYISWFCNFSTISTSEVSDVSLISAGIFIHRMNLFIKWMRITEFFLHYQRFAGEWGAKYDTGWNCDSVGIESSSVKNNCLGFLALRKQSFLLFNFCHYCFGILYWNRIVQLAPLGGRFSMDRYWVYSTPFLTIIILHMKWYDIEIIWSYHCHCTKHYTKKMFSISKHIQLSILSGRVSGKI